MLLVVLKQCNNFEMTAIVTWSTCTLIKLISVIAGICMCVNLVGILMVLTVPCRSFCTTYLCKFNVHCLPFTFINRLRHGTWSPGHLDHFPTGSPSTSIFSRYYIITQWDNYSKAPCQLHYRLLWSCRLVEVISGIMKNNT